VVKKRTIGLYPYISENSGFGHLKRLLKFLNDDRFIVYFLQENTSWLKSALKMMDLSHIEVFSISEIILKKIELDFIILDNKQTDTFLYDQLSRIAPIISLDEGSLSREKSCYTIDILPNLLSVKPNYFNPGLLDLEIIDKNFKKRKNINKVLITFGGQDPYNLTEKAVDLLKKRYELTTVIGPLFKKNDFGVTKIVNPEKLSDIIPEFDIVITSFGITAYEAVALSTPVALLNPTKYHTQLSKKAGFYILNEKWSINYSKAVKKSNTINIGNKETLTDFIYSLNLVDNKCPICNKRNNKSIERFKLKTYYKCSNCKMTYMTYHGKKTEYTHNYFFDDYKIQYGKTYLDDFENIKKLGIQRIEHISRRLEKNSTIVDIGCAYGPFLEALKESGFKPFGIDVSSDAIDYVNNELKIDSMVSSFPLDRPLTLNNGISGITMWYVIEHFENIDLVLSQINNLLPLGGTFSFSTPNLAGISGKKSLRKFLQMSPNDHYTLWEPKTAKKVLKQYGFKVYKINITGHHPERFGGWAKGKVLTKIVNCYSKIFSFGDTFEIFCIKDNNL